MIEGATVGISSAILVYSVELPCTVHIVGVAGNRPNSVFQCQSLVYLFMIATELIMALNGWTEVQFKFW